MSRSKQYPSQLAWAPGLSALTVAVQRRPDRACLSISNDRDSWAAPHCQEIEPRTNGVLNINFWTEQSPAPQIVNRSNAYTSGKYPCLKAGRMLQWRTRSQLQLMRLLDCDPYVSMFREQPCVIMYSFRGLVQSHSPSLLVNVGTRKELWDVIPTADALALVPRTVLLTRGLAILGYVYQAVSQSEVIKQPRLNNVQVLLQFGRHSPSIISREAFRRKLGRDGYVTWEDAYCEKCGPNGRETLSRLVLEGGLLFDINQPLDAAKRFFNKERAV
jgi:hypothetical protein